MARIHDAVSYMEKLRRPNGFLLTMLREAAEEYDAAIQALSASQKQILILEHERNDMQQRFDIVLNVVADVVTLPWFQHQILQELEERMRHLNGETCG